ncbi:hypothetical protein SDC9_185503 [bioreactor metagenome]|uniref:Uncharacterized protein n=1 Tax=bioreactor metagenome TaxID=1076179 RepID=A0A645HHW4_9ZZZZ
MKGFLPPDGCPGDGKGRSVAHGHAGRRRGEARGEAVP